LISTRQPLKAKAIDNVYKGRSVFKRTFEESIDESENNVRAALSPF
jgi:hypothetical protein